MTSLFLLLLAADTYPALVREYDDAVASFRQVYDAAATPKDRQAVIEKLFPKPAAFAPRFLAVGGVDALSWVVLHPIVPGTKGSELRAEALAELARKHAKDPRAAALCTRLVLTVDADSEAFLRAAGKDATERPAAARATAALAHNLRHRAGLVSRLKDDAPGLAEYQRQWGKPALDALMKADPAKLEGEAKGLFERVAAKYADVPHPTHGTFGAFAAAHLAAIDDPVAADRAAPEVAGVGLDGKPLKLSSYRGKVVLVDFWSHAFEPCREKFAYQKKLRERMDGKPFAMLGVNADGDRAAAAKASEKAGLTWPSWFDGGGTSGPIATRWDVDQWPAVVLIDHAGVVRQMWTGWPDEKELEKAIGELLARVKP